MQHPSLPAQEWPLFQTEKDQLGIDRKILVVLLDILKDSLILAGPVMLGAILTLFIGR